MCGLEPTQQREFIATWFAIDRPQGKYVRFAGLLGTDLRHAVHRERARIAFGTRRAGRCQAKRTQQGQCEAGLHGTATTCHGCSRVFQNTWKRPLCTSARGWSDLSPVLARVTSRHCLPASSERSEELRVGKGGVSTCRSRG